MLKLDRSKNTGMIFVYELDGYKMNFKKNEIEIFYEPWLLSILEKEFDPDYLKLVARILSFLNDESDEDPDELMYELREIRMIFYNKYEKYLGANVVKRYFKQINILRNELNLITYKKDILSSRKR